MRATLCRATQDEQVTVESSDKMWSPGEGNGEPLQYSCLEHPMNSMKIVDIAIPKESTGTSPGKPSVIKDFTMMARHALRLHDQEMLWGGNPGTKDCMALKEDFSAALGVRLGCRFVGLWFLEVG